MRPGPYNKIYRPSKKSAPTVAVRRSMMLKDYYGQEGSRRQRRTRSIIILMAIALLIQSFFQIPFFRIKQVDIQGLKYIDDSVVRSIVDQELARRRFLIFSNNNVWLFSSKKIRQRLDSELRLDVMRLHRKPPSTVELTLRERVSGFVHQTPEGYDLLDIHGQSAGSVDKPPAGQVIIADERLSLSSAIPLDYLESATLIVEEWRKASLPVELDKFHITDDTSKIIVSTDKGWQVYFHPERDVAQQVARLSLFLQDTNLEAPHAYLDLRFFDDSLYSK